MLVIKTTVRTDERGFLCLEYLGRRLMTFRGEQKLILKQLIEQIEEEVSNGAAASN